jgi:hypothetical protein
MREHVQDINNSCSKYVFDVLCVTLGTQISGNITKSEATIRSER